MKVKEKSEKVGLKLNIQRTKIMASSPITSWQIDGKTEGTVADFILGGSKIPGTGESGGLPSMGSHRVGHDWSDLAVANIRVHSACLCACLAASVMSNSVRPHRRKPTRLPRPWDSPGKNTGVGCHFFLQCMKAKSESEVSQSCPTLCDPMECSPPGSPMRGIEL